jgi:phage N-6-adenine-methyltransferase
MSSGQGKRQEPTRGRPRIYKTNADRQRAYRRRQKRSVHFRSETDLWETPLDFFAELDAEFRFQLDVCAIAENAKCPRFFSPEEDGLTQTWTGICWMNPPYGRAIGAWIEKAWRSARDGATVVCLVPARTDTRWWHEYVMKASEVRYLRGRLKFGGEENSAPFPSALVVFGQVKS